MLVCDFLRDSAEKDPDKVACVCGEQRWTYGEVYASANRLAHALLDSGHQRTERVAVLLENCCEAVVSVFGILIARCAFVVINPTTKADKLAYILRDCGATAVVATGRLAAVVSEALRRAPSVRTLVTSEWKNSASPDVSKVRIDFERDVSRFRDDPPVDRNLDVDLAAIIYTSGTTGRPKGVTVTHQNVVAAATSITEYLENVPEDIILNALPLSFDYGLYQVLMSAKIGATLVLEKSFTYPYEIVKRVREERVTGFPGVPMMFALLLQMRKLNPAELDTVRYVSNTGAALPAAHITRLKGLFRKARMYSMYGVTECKRVAYLPPEEIDRRPTSVGRAMPNCETYIVDENDRPVKAGEIGELVVRGPNVMQGYWNLPEETNRILRPGRYPWEKVLYTGDLFKMDEDGYLYFVSRKDDIIKSRGEKVSPREVENVIHELTEVREVAVVGIPDPILGEAVKALVVRADGARITGSNIRTHCKKRLEDFMVPKVVEFLESLPTTSSGKVARSELKDVPLR